MLFLGVCGVTTASAQSFDPAYRFRTLRTDHFAIHFHRDEEPAAARLADIAEETWRTLRLPGLTFPSLTHVVLADQTELANGYATPLPRDAIVIYAAWPTATDTLLTDDWLRLVFTHEFTHTVHLSQSRGWARMVRNVFGRVPVAFPNLFLPGWQIEGLATWQESMTTGRGRLHAGNFRAITTEAARSGTLEPLDRVNGGLTDWPAGQAQYAYGLEFQNWLAERFGAQSLAELARITAGRVPFLASPAFREVYGTPLGALWAEHQASLTEQSGRRAQAPSPGPSAQRLTRHGFVVTGPRFVSPSCDGCDAEVIYSVRNAHEFPSLYRVAVAGGEAAQPAPVTSRFYGSTIGAGKRSIYFDQLEIHNNVGVYGDLYELERATGKVRRLTAHARLADPDLSPDETTVVAVRSGAGHRDLVTVTVQSLGSDVGEPAITTLAAEPETQFGAPRWSPDGRSIAAIRHTRGRLPEVVLVDVATRSLRVVASRPDVRWATPTWRPDGRAIVAAAEVAGHPFELFELALDRSSARQLSSSTGGATWPDVAPDGRSIVYVGYDASGSDLFLMPYPEVSGSDVWIDPGSDPDAVERGVAPDPLANTWRQRVDDASSYSPWSTILPTSWSPIIEGTTDDLRLGALASGTDVLGYHAYRAAVTRTLTSPGEVPAGNTPTNWNAAYVYRRWATSVWAGASRESDFVGVRVGETGVVSETLRTTTAVEAGVTIPVVRALVTRSTSFSFRRAYDDFVLPDGPVRRDQSAIRASWGLWSSNQYGYSISEEDGVGVGITSEVMRRAFGASGDAATVTGDARFYLGGLRRHHVFAARAAAGVTTGDDGAGRLFLLGGAEPRPSTVDFDSDAIGMLRGFPEASFAGSRIAVANVDYRLPLARPQRGLGTLPFFLHTLHAAVFADAGAIWSKDVPADGWKLSLGAEAAADVVLGYGWPVTVAVGAAWGREVRAEGSSGGRAYLRVGRAF